MLPDDDTDSNARARASTVAPFRPFIPSGRRPSPLNATTDVDLRPSPISFLTSDIPLCPSCQYPRSGLATRRCPECGYETTDADIVLHPRRALFLELTTWPARGWIAFHVVVALTLGVWPLIPLAILLAVGWRLHHSHIWLHRRVLNRAWTLVVPWLQLCWVTPQAIGITIDLVYWNTPLLDTLYWSLPGWLEPDHPIAYVSLGVLTALFTTPIALVRLRRLKRIAGVSGLGLRLTPMEALLLKFAILIPSLIVGSLVLTVLIVAILDRVSPGWEMP